MNTVASGPVKNSRTDSKSLMRATWAPMVARSVKPGGSDRMCWRMLLPMMLSRRAPIKARMRARTVLRMVSNTNAMPTPMLNASKVGIEPVPITVS